ncbi:MAG: Mut7-C RNAse domain-containing protein [Sulfolobales archaeon]|jgi:uncharacterized protein with PIN domain
MPIEPRFVVDTMLGNLARWLRILGYDTLYSNRYSDYRILKISEEDRRVLVTRDRGLFIRAKKNNLEAVLIETESVEEMLRILRKRYNIRLEVDPNDTRCPACNYPLKRTTSLTEVAGKVSSEIASKYREFWVCYRCGKVYWRGNHWKTIEKTLERARSVE